MAGAIFNTVPPLAAGAGMKFDGERFSTAAAPRNLLDNSDFRHPVNQRKQSTYSKDSGYTIDRWMFYWNGDGTIEVKDGFISLSRATYTAQLFQKVQGLVSGRKYTIAAMVRGHGSINWRDVSNDIKSVATVNSDNWTVITASFVFEPVTSNQFGHPVFGIASESNKKIDICWAAIYDGDYTIDTLPAYQPKGYSAELAECRRYFRQNEKLNCVAAGADGYYSVAKTIEMRAVPAVTIGIFSPYGSPDVQASDDWTLSVSAESKGVVVLDFAHLPGVTNHGGALGVTLDANL